MSASNKSRLVRDRLVSALRRELMGPSEPDEVITEFPTTRYLAGRLAPARASDDDQDAEIDVLENDTLAVGGDDDEAGKEDAHPPLIIGFNPSSFGLSFLVDIDAANLRVNVSWGDYKREREDGAVVWRRYPRDGIVDGVPIGRSGPIPRITLSPSVTNPSGVVITGLDDQEITLEGVVHEFAGYRAVSLFLINRRTKGQLGDRTKDERWVFQPFIRVTTSDDRSIFVAKDFRPDAAPSDEDGESAINSLLYRHAREFATGHGVAANWDKPGEDGKRTTAVYTEFVPSFEVPLLIARSEQTGAATLDMRTIAESPSAADIAKMLEPMAIAYESWIDTIEHESKASEIQDDARLSDSAKVNIEQCRACAARIRDGIELLRTDAHVLEAFQFANATMWDQRIHSLWSASNRKRGEVQGAPADYDKSENRTWRPFQMGFILLNLRGIVDENSNDRKLVDLLWFPTGGGKTEAYLGLAAFTLALRRLRGDKHGMHAGAGVSIIMRYTLRLLTVQQFQRAAALICACELQRRRNVERWGAEPFRIGVWVGRGTTPNTFADSLKALEDINDGKKPKEGSPIQLVSCPRCGTTLVTDKGVPESQTYIPDTKVQRTRICCRNPSCEFSARNSDDEGIPAVVVDDEIYRTCPSLIVATVDKFARLPFKGETRSIFGFRNRHSPTYGHLTEAHGELVGGRKVRDAEHAPQLLPPELIIQDELHLISGPLGTMVGLYEAAVEYVTSQKSSQGLTVPAKVIASTATIRRAAQQARQLYARKLAIFPPSGLTARDSFFANELSIDESDDGTAGRIYVGVNAPGSSTKTLLVRVYSILLAMAQAEINGDPNAADPYGTLVGYFNSLRALGGAKRLVEDDVKLVRLRYLTQQRGLPRRPINDPEELTSRVDSWRIPSLLKKLDNAFPRGKSDWPVDVLLATNMISVGVDIDRLGLMAVTGQPKTTAEYIQATSRVGRKHPGLVVTMYNWMGARDLSHYERFHSYHSALYRYVEAISVTPFSSRALDRGLRGVFAALNRLTGPAMSMEPQAERFDPTEPSVQAIIDEIVSRAALLVGKDNAELVRARLMSYRDDWSHFAEDLLRYCWLDDERKPPNNTRVLLRTAGTKNEGEWSTPGSLREVEPTAAFYLDEEN
ncbi:helicase [Burkholderia cepacia]|nr:helicase [Burkholderia cepacia]